jgi:hypothetical protein
VHDGPQFSALKLNRDAEKLAWVARAHITWGDSPDEVQDWLCKEGVDREIARLIVDACLAERDRSLRLKGIRDLVYGGVAIVGAAGLIAAVMSDWFPANMKGGIFFSASGLGMLYGAYLVWRGAERVTLGAKVRCAESDVEEW